MGTLDVICNTLYGRRRCRVMTLIDEDHREALALAIGTSLPAARVTRVLDELVARQGRPDAIRVNDGPHRLAGF